MDFNKLKTNSSLDKLTKKLEEQSQSNSFVDDRYWRPTVDKAGNGSAVIRLLPTPPQDLAVNEDATPWVKYFDHNFRGPGGWYIERCLTSLGKVDPVAEYNNKLWNSNIEANQNIARKQKRNQRIVSNILIVSDPAHPELDGQIKLFRFGPKLMEKFQAAITGDEDTPGFNPWDLWQGKDFRIKIKTIVDKKTNDKFPSYEDSKFATKSSLPTDDDELKTLWNKEYSLLDEIASNKFKTYDELKAQLNKVLALSDVVVEVKGTAEAEPIEVKEPKSEPKKEAKTDVPWEADGEVDSTLAMFEKLAQDI